MKLIKRIAFGSAGLLVLLMMTATVVEKLQGTGTAWTAIYGSPFFTILWGILAVCAFQGAEDVVFRVVRQDYDRDFHTDFMKRGKGRRNFSFLRSFRSDFLAVRKPADM